jgi:hypothetical protein
MDFAVLFQLLVTRTITFFLDFLFNGMFDFLSDVLFGG